MPFLHIAQPNPIILQVLLIQTRINMLLLHTSAISKHATWAATSSLAESLSKNQRLPELGSNLLLISLNVIRASIIATDISTYIQTVRYASVLPLKYSPINTHCKIFWSVIVSQPLKQGKRCLPAPVMANSETWEGYLRRDWSLLWLADLRKWSSFGSAFHFYSTEIKEDQRRKLKAKNSSLVLESLFLVSSFCKC